MNYLKYRDRFRFYGFTQNLKGQSLPDRRRYGQRTASRFRQKKRSGFPYMQRRQGMLGDDDTVGEKTGKAESA